MLYLKKKLIDTANFIERECEYTIESEEEIEKFNKHIIKEDEVDETNEDEIVDGNKRCGGMYHDTEESRILPLSEYFKNKSNFIRKRFYLISFVYLQESRNKTM
jgi:hypothetical protein